MALQSIGDLTFAIDPNLMDIPESKKSVATVDTYTGSVIFQWDAILEGVEVELKWNWMTLAFYTALRTKYLTTDAYVWDPDTGDTYNVIMINLDGSYFEEALSKIAYRKDITLRLSIRSLI